MKAKLRGDRLVGYRRGRPHAAITEEINVKANPEINLTGNVESSQGGRVNGKGESTMLVDVPKGKT